jgi:hypothetical protein
MDDFITSWSCVRQKTDMFITCIFKTYDLVDSDLDFDEAYYSELLQNFELILMNECKTMLTDFLNIEIVLAETIMKNHNVVHKKVLLCSNSTSITIY